MHHTIAKGGQQSVRTVNYHIGAAIVPKTPDEMVCCHEHIWKGVILSPSLSLSNWGRVPEQELRPGHQLYNGSLASQPAELATALCTSSTAPQPDRPGARPPFAQGPRAGRPASPASTSGLAPAGLGGPGRPPPGVGLRLLVISLLAVV